MAENQIIGTQDNDFLLDTNLEDEILAFAGDDEIETSKGNDIIFGDEGIDKLTINYSRQNSDLIFYFQNYDNFSGDGSLNIDFPGSGNNNYLNFYSIEDFEIITGGGNDVVDTNTYYLNGIISTGTKDDLIIPGKGFKLVDGGSGFDTLDLNFYDSLNGVTSSLNDSHSGEYTSDESTVEFSNIEAINVTGSQYDDILAAATGTNNNGIPTTINGNGGFDELVVDYSDRNNDHEVMVDGSSLNTYDYQTGTNNYINYSDIEAFNITTGRGNNFINLGFDSFSDDTINAGGGDDNIFTGKGFDFVDGGNGFDVLNLDFNSSNNGVTSSLNDSHSGEYVSDEGAVEFSNIEAINVQGSQYNDVLVAVTSNSNVNVPVDSIIDGGNGIDELVVDYSNNNQDLNLVVDTYGSNSGNLNTFDNGNNSSISFNSIERFNVTTGRGNNNIDLGYDNLSDDTVNAGAGDDFISAGKGFDFVDGGNGFDVLNLDFSNSITGVTSSLSDINSGEYISNEGANGNSAIEFDNIEAFNIFGSQYNDVLVATPGYSNDTNFPFGIPIIEGGNGIDELVVDYSAKNQNLDVLVSNNSLLAVDPQTGSNYNLNWNGIEGFNLTTGRGDNNIDFGVDNSSDDTVNAGAGNDMISTGMGNDTLDGGSGNDILQGGEGEDTYIFELGSGIDTISDFSADLATDNNDTIIFGSGITLDNLSWNFRGSDLVFDFANAPNQQLIIENYQNTSYRIENIEVEGQTIFLENFVEIPEIMGEFGQISNFNHNSQEILLDNNYQNPVILAMPLSSNGEDPAIVRITDIQSDRFTAYLQEPEYSDGVHDNESFSYMVLEAGTWELDNGTLLEVGTVNTDLVTTEGWENIDFGADFADTPAIFSQVQTDRESEFVRTRQNYANMNGFSLSMEEEDALNTSGHATETVGWLAIDAGEGNWGEWEYEVGSTEKRVDHRPYNLNFSQDFTNEPSLFASLASFYGGDSSGLRYQNLNNAQVQINVEEDTSLDSEIIHTTEIVDYLAISGQGDLSAFAYEPTDSI